MPAWYATVSLGGALNDEKSVEVAGMARIAGVVSSTDQRSTEVRIKLTSPSWDRALLEVRDRVRVIEQVSGRAATGLVLSNEMTSVDGVALVGPGEVARLLGIGRARLSALRQSDPAFPAPIPHSGTGDAWPLDVITSYATARAG